MVFLFLQDIAIHTRVTPQNRQIAVRKFLRNVNENPEAKAQLSMWGLELDSDTIQVCLYAIDRGTFTLHCVHVHVCYVCVSFLSSFLVPNFQSFHVIYMF